MSLPTSELLPKTSSPGGFPEVTLPVRARPGPLWPPTWSHRWVPPRRLSRHGRPVPRSHPVGLIPGVRFPGAPRPHSPGRPSSARSSGRSGTERGPMSACGRSPGASAECGRRQRQETDSLRRRVRGGGNAAGGAGAGPTGPGGRRGWTPPSPRGAVPQFPHSAVRSCTSRGAHWKRPRWREGTGTRGRCPQELPGLALLSGGVGHRGSGGAHPPKLFPSCPQ